MVVNINKSEKYKNRLIEHLKMAILVIGLISMTISAIITRKMPQLRSMLTNGTGICMVVSLFVAMCFFIVASIYNINNNAELANKHFDNSLFFGYLAVIFWMLVRM